MSRQTHTRQSDRPVDRRKEVTDDGGSGGGRLVNSSTEPKNFGAVELRDPKTEKVLVIRPFVVPLFDNMVF